jgi:conjugative relaxase-like TrwC/TraI family protein
MAWMRMMGRDSVDYHRDTVLTRGDDFPGQALAYYASRGETPLVWGGAGAEALGLVGAVTPESYEAIFGPGGARDPGTGERLVQARSRPGMELVVSAHKSVAELGVIGAAEDMHVILDAERIATLAYLDRLTHQRGGRRGREMIPAPTGGLIYAVTRHATSRAGDPCPHDHVLLANVIEMRDGLGGYKAPDTAVRRDHLHAATIVWRMAAARVAVSLGYAIEADAGSSGKLGHWRIAGIPDEVLAVHSKRAADIDAAVAGADTWRARQIAARKTRAVKRHEAVDELLPHWRAEVASIGWPVERIATEVAAAADRAVPVPPLNADELPVAVASEVAKAVTADGALSRAKVFSRPDVIVAVGPALYGRPSEDLTRVVDAVIASAEVLPLVRVAGARERHYTTASVVARETAIARAVARGAGRTDVAVLYPEDVRDALARAEQRLGHRLTRGQLSAVAGICTGGAGVSLVLGVAGAGKTTALSCVRDAYERADFTVIGTATSGQAARMLGREAGITESRTLASLQARLRTGSVRLDDSTVVVLDEAGMTDDPDLLNVLTAAELVKAKVVLVGDDRQLGAVGPGGALRALIERHGGRVHVLDQNVRQRDSRERAALAQLRSGSVERAVAFYARAGRISLSPDRDTALIDTVDSWANDLAAGQDAAIYAWRRTDVAELNALARDRMAGDGRLGEPELVVDGRAFAKGDLVVTLAPGHETVTSQRGLVVEVRPHEETMLVRFDGGAIVRLGADEAGTDRLDYAYALTVHRAQGATVDVAHRFEDGGGRELAYVAMSRGRERNVVHVVADDVGQAIDDLRRDWSRAARPRWAIDTGTPVTEPLDVETSHHVDQPVRRALGAARLAVEHGALRFARLSTPRPERAEMERRLHELRTDQHNLGATSDERRVLPRLSERPRLDLQQDVSR